MNKKLKELCKWDQGSFDKKLDLLLPIVTEPKYVCKTCGRAASAKKYLCKPFKLPVPLD